MGEDGEDPDKEEKEGDEEGMDGEEGQEEGQGGSQANLEGMDGEEGGMEGEDGGSPLKKKKTTKSISKGKKKKAVNEDKVEIAKSKPSKQKNKVILDETLEIP